MFELGGYEVWVLGPDVLRFNRSGLLRLIGTKGSPSTEYSMVNVTVFGSRSQEETSVECEILEVKGEGVRCWAHVDFDLRFLESRRSFQLEKLDVEESPHACGQLSTQNISRVGTEESIPALNWWPWGAFRTIHSCCKM